MPVKNFYLNIIIFISIYMCAILDILIQHIEKMNDENLQIRTMFFLNVKNYKGTNRHIDKHVNFN